MSIYNPQSSIAEQFISHDEILATLDYAAAHRGDSALINDILKKAAEARGLTPREAAVLLECSDSDTIERIFSIARDIKQRSLISSVGTASSRRQVTDTWPSSAKATGICQAPSGCGKWALRSRPSPGVRAT